MLREFAPSARLAGTDIVNARRQTFYGSTETIFRDGAGNVVTLAQMA
jgi:hypothetical protein